MSIFDNGPDGGPDVSELPELPPEDPTGLPADELPEPEPEPDQVEDDGGLVFTSLDSFVTDYIGQILCRRLNRATAIWCPEWWRHPEALVRLSAMWRAFEYLRVDAALGMSTFWLHHADPHMRVLMDPEFGPFALCDPREGHAVRELEPLPMAPSPPEIWDHPAYRLDASDVAGGDAGSESGQPPSAPAGYTKDMGMAADY
ncbi:hypothetical protein GCM10023205_38970 [Yinghuangia aomiensis]|uniref:DUF4913 domain-containing protein n=1 Tax=Yinghuangia aomiensis TaxID=676205 RepID=A0ABP9HFV0_9ACTN